MPRRRKQGRLSGKRYESFPFAVAEKAGVVRLTTADMFKRKNPAKAPAAAGSVNEAAPMTGAPARKLLSDVVGEICICNVSGICKPGK